MPSFIIRFFGLALTSLLVDHWWFFISYLVIIILNFGVLETKFLCSHCPYYADDGRILHCLALDGSPKFWKYNPEPMSELLCPEERCLLVISDKFIQSKKREMNEKLEFV
jgi:hypothetical protein